MNKVTDRSYTERCCYCNRFVPEEPEICCKLFRAMKRKDLVMSKSSKSSSNMQLASPFRIAAERPRELTAGEVREIVKAEVDSFLQTKRSQKILNKEPRKPLTKWVKCHLVAYIATALCFGLWFLCGFTLSKIEMMAWGIPLIITEAVFIIVRIASKNVDL